MKKFVQMGGAIHLAIDGEHLLCNTATFDAADSEGDEDLRWHETTEKIVSCTDCIALILLCKGVRIASKGEER